MELSGTRLLPLNEAADRFPLNMQAVFFLFMPPPLIYYLFHSEATSSMMAAKYQREKTLQVLS